MLSASPTFQVSDAVQVSHIPPAPIRVAEGPWSQIPGGVTAPCGFQAAGIYAGLRAVGNKPDLALVLCDTDAVCAGTFTTNVVAAAPVLYSKKILLTSSKARAVLINAGQANAATGDEGYRDSLDCANAVAKLIAIEPEKVLLQSTGVIGHRIKKDALISSLPRLVQHLSPEPESGIAAAVAITTTDLVSKSIAIETKLGGKTVKIGGMAKGSGMIHPNMATMLGVITCDANVIPDLWQSLIRTSVNRSFNQITVDGDTSTNDTVFALANGASGGRILQTAEDRDVQELQAALDAVLQGLAQSIASDGEGATCLIEVEVTGARCEADAARVARSVARSSLTKAAVFGRDPNWGRIACAAGYAGVDFNPLKLNVRLGKFELMRNGQPVQFHREAAKDYLSSAGQSHGLVRISIDIGDGEGQCKAWGCDLSYDYVKINAEYTT